MSEVNLTDYKSMIKEAAKMPKGRYKAVTSRTHGLVGELMRTRQHSFWTYSDPVKAMKKAKRMAMRRDFLTRLASDVEYGICYFIIPEET